MAKRDEGDQSWIVKKVAQCPPVPTAASIFWEGGGRFLTEALNNEVDASKINMPRWLTKTVDGCVPTVTSVSDEVMNNLINSRQDQYDNGGLSNEDKKALGVEISQQKPTNDHVCKLFIGEKETENCYLTGI